MEQLATILQDLGFLLYGGPMVAWAVLMRAQGRLHQVDLPSIIRVFRSWGPGFGLALGAAVLGALLSRFLNTGSFTWSCDTPEACRDTVVWGLFLVMWASNIKLEIWSLEPLRKLDKDGTISDLDQYNAAAAKFSNHLSLHAALVIAVAIGFALIRT